MRTVLLGLVLVVAGAAASAQAAGDVQTGRAVAAVGGCFACHGETGVSTDPDIPNLAGQPPDYLINQLRAFAAVPPTGLGGLWVASRTHPNMSPRADRLSEVEIEDLAAYFSVQACPAPKASPSETPPSRAARCLTCHGDAEKREAQGIPIFSGQKRGYLARQIRLLRAGALDREDGPVARSHPVMGLEAGVVSDADVDALAAYLSTQPCP